MDTNRLARVASDLARITSDLSAENAKMRELLLDYDKMLAIAADELGYQSRGLRMDSVLNALRIRMYELGIEVDDGQPEL